jgi:hypothetical protein
MRPEFLAEQLGLTVRGLLDPLALRVAALETAGGPMAERLTLLEARTPLPGPPGPPGPPGRDGLDGKDGQGLRYLGVHVAGKTYDVGDLVTAGGSAWYCGRTTTGDPGKSPDWQLMVKRGRDARERSAP